MPKNGKEEVKHLVVGHNTLDINRTKIIFVVSEESYQQQHSASLPEKAYLYLQLCNHLFLKGHHAIKGSHPSAQRGSGVLFLVRFVSLSLCLFVC